MCMCGVGLFHALGFNHPEEYVEEDDKLTAEDKVSNSDLSNSDESKNSTIKSEETS